MIPQRVEMKGTVRTLSKEMRDLAEDRLTTLATGLAASFGASATVDYQRNYPVTVNHPEQTEFAALVATKVSGGCAYADLVMGGEDFSFMLEERPGAYILTGNGASAALHHPEYDFDDEAIPVGCSWWAGIIEERMPAA